MESNQNSPGRDAAKKLSRIPRYQEFKNSPKEDPKRLLGDLSPQGDPKVQEIHAA